MKKIVQAGWSTGVILNNDSHCPTLYWCGKIQHRQCARLRKCMNAEPRCEWDRARMVGRNPISNQWCDMTVAEHAKIDAKIAKITAKWFTRCKPIKITIER